MYIEKKLKQIEIFDYDKIKLKIYHILKLNLILILISKKILFYFQMILKLVE